MDPLVGGALIGAGSQAVNQITQGIGAGRARKHQRRMLEWQFAQERAMSDLAYQRDVEMWNRMNLYNSPLKQMERFRRAGLNPNLIYGKGSASAGNATQMAKYQRPNVPDAQAIQSPWFPQIDPLSMMAQFQQVSQAVAQVGNINANTNLVNEKANNERIRGAVMKTEGNLKKNQLYVSSSTLPYQTAYKKIQTNRAQLELQRVEKQIESEIERIKNLRQTRENIKLARELASAQIAVQLMQVQIQQQTLDTYGAKGPMGAVIKQTGKMLERSGIKVNWEKLRIFVPGGK